MTYSESGGHGEEAAAFRAPTDGHIESPKGQDSIAKEDVLPVPEKEMAEFKFMKDEGQREMLAERVMDLIEKVRTDGIRNIVFLDKSARPLSTLYLDLWRRSYPQYEPTEINFVNIGKETSAAASHNDDLKDIRDPDFPSSKIDPESLSSEMVEKFVGADEIKRVRETYKHLRDAAPGRPVLIVEEYTNTGLSLAWAKKILKTIFPDLRFETFSVAQQVDSYDKKDEDLALFERWHDPISKTSTFFNPPWRQPEESDQYGVTGVVDRKGSLTAMPTGKYLTPEMKDKKFAERTSMHKEHLEKTLPEQIVSTIMDVNRMLTRLNDAIRDAQSNISTEKGPKGDVEKMMIELIEEANIVPYWTELSGLVSEFLAAVSQDRWEVAGSLVDRLSELEKNSEKKINNITREKTHIFYEYLERIGLGSELADELYLPWKNLLYEKIYQFATTYNCDSGVLTNMKRIIDYHKNLERGLQEPAYEPSIAQLRKEMHMIADEYWQKRRQDVK